MKKIRNDCQDLLLKRFRKTINIGEGRENKLNIFKQDICGAIKAGRTYQNYKYGNEDKWAGETGNITGSQRH